MIDYRCTDCGATDPKDFYEPPCPFCGVMECLKCGGEVQAQTGEQT